MLKVEPGELSVSYVISAVSALMCSKGGALGESRAIVSVC